MKVLLVLLLFAYELSIIAHIQNLKMNTEFTVDLSQFPEYEIPSNTNQYFIIPVNGDKKIEIQLKTFHGSTPSTYFNVDFCSFSKLPSNDEVIIGNKNCFKNWPYTSISQYDIYDIYKYHVEANEEVEYLSMQIENLFTCDYLSIYYYQIDSTLDYKIYDISYMKEYKLNSTSLNDRNNLIIFRMENIGNIGSIRIKVSNEFLSKIKITISGYRDKPNMTDDFDDYIRVYNPEIKSLIKDEKYLIYEYPYEKIDDTGYICIFIDLKEKVDFLSIYVGS